jgi:hypothetical protein
MAEAGAYPPAILADLAVQLLAEQSKFSVRRALHGGQAELRGNAESSGCCVVDFNLTQGTGPFYFGHDADGYILVTARTSLPDWPCTADGRPKPIRLTRWLLEAPRGSVVRHSCDTPPCVRRDHLFIGSVHDNVADRIRRRRRQLTPTQRALRTPAKDAAQAAHSNVQQPPPTAMATRRVSAILARESTWKMAGLQSPSKMARKIAKKVRGTSPWRARERPSLLGRAAPGRSALLCACGHQRSPSDLDVERWGGGVWDPGGSQGDHPAL